MSTPEPPYDRLRSRAFAVAYRMLGSVAEAEDVVQEALLRVHRAVESGETLASPLAYVVTVTTRLAIDVLRSARVRRETYVGTWLPEPVLTGPPADDPERGAELAQSLSIAFLVLLERLTPQQRAALLLHDVFDYGYDEVARVLDTSEVNARQLAARARRGLAEGRRRATPSTAEREELADRFFAATFDGDLAGLEALLAEDAVLQGDTGGKVPALSRALEGRERVARVLLGWARSGWTQLGATVERVEVNGGPGALVLAPDRGILAVVALEIAGGRIAGVTSIVNPDKLRHLGPVGDLAALRRARSTPEG